MSALQVGENANIIATGGSLHPILRAKWLPPSRPLKRLNVRKGPDKWSQCKQSHVNKCIADLCKLVMPNMPSAPFLMMSQIFPHMSQAMRSWPVYADGGMHHWTLLEIFKKIFRPIEKQWILHFSRLGWSWKKKTTPHFGVIGHMSRTWEGIGNLRIVIFSGVWV